MPSPEQKKSFRNILERWAEGDLHVKVEKGESPLEAWERAKGLFDHILHHHSGQNILLCSHGRQLRVIFANLLGVGMDNMEQYFLRNTALSIIQIAENHRGALEVFNDISHLTASGVKTI